ncbi:GOLD domain-containing protein [Lachancea thermotolerans]|uniref:KLTH0E08206p n=1 Tax=Lachancea thermotolerans (strain ATCC 56472 / CBS 6340 / NRRL Y-8284) TaxID=559295 RepID=C5DHY7_LACTC|nr:KLTH0E08206p [Lachancea thermotolerans CBS 6340]CAR23398.1 KLTH0E08206p [Lachancea thermotolerans CBS 6340]
MKLFTCLLQLSALLLLTPFANAFYYYSSGGERRCFHKELPKNTLLQGKYSVQTYDDKAKAYVTPSRDQLSVVVEVEEIFDDNHRVMNQKLAAQSEFTFNAHDSGEHKICIQPQSTGWLAKVKTKVDIEFQTGSDASLDSKGKNTMQSLQSKIKVLNDRVEEIRREQELVREREAMFRDVSESANSRAMWWTVFQVVVLAGTCAWQLRHLRTFFVKQKIL